MNRPGTAKVTGRLASGRAVYVYCETDVRVTAPVDAMRLLQRLPTDPDRP